MNDKNQDCTVVVCSCDKYADIPGLFVALWARFWPDCPFETVLLTETVPTPGFDRVVTTGLGHTWCEMLTMALEEIKTPYILLLMNDYFLNAPVDTAAFLRRLDEAKRYDAANLRLNPNPPGRREWPDSDLMEMPKDTAYCITCQVGIWNREFLLALARRNKSAWEFERRGSFQLGGETRPLLVTKKKEFPFVDAVHKGCWEKIGLAVCRENGVEVDLSKRGLPALRTRLLEGMKWLIFAIFPWSLIVRVQNALDIGAKERK